MTNNQTLSHQKKDYSMFENIKLEDTGVFNYKGRQSTVFNRFNDSGIVTLKDLFLLDDLNEINYGNDRQPSNQNLHIHDEIKGIIILLRYKYLNESSDKLTRLFDYNIQTKENITISPYTQYGYPGDIFKNAIWYNKEDNSYKKIYEILKKCGFDQSASKAILDDIYNKRIQNVTLGQYLTETDISSIKKIFSKVQNEYKVFINILYILLDYYKNVYLQKKLENNDSIHKLK